MKRDNGLRLHLLYIKFQTPTKAAAAAAAHMDFISCNTIVILASLRLQYDRLSPLLDLILFKLRTVHFFGLSCTRWFVLNVGLYVNPAAMA